MKERVKRYMISRLEEWEKDITDLADSIHGFAELAGEEYHSMEALCSYLEKRGFQTERGLGSQKTAFRAVYGEGKPVIGFLAEYDALPELAWPACPDSRGINGPGHGCGHNLLGAAAAAAASALADAMGQERREGTLVVYGTPAEETLYGKNQLLKEGYFKELDAALCWHPGRTNHCGEYQHKAMHSVKFFFRGRPAHASVCPELGRSALDACELMNVGCNYLREHVSTDVRMHYSYEDFQNKPNVVPEYGGVWYFIRARRRKTADEVLDRIRKIARGAALMTETDSEEKLLASGSETIINSVLSEIVYENMKLIGAPQFSEEDMSLARHLAEPLGLPGILDRRIEKPDGKIKEEPGSSDFSDVSQEIPAVELGTTCFIDNTPGHHWTVTAAAASGFGHKGMLFAAKVLAATGYDLVDDEERLGKVKEEFIRRKRENELYAG